MTDQNGAESAPEPASEPFQPMRARRHRKTSVVTLHFELHELSELRALAERHGLSLRELLRQAVWYAVAHMGVKKP